MQSLITAGAKSKTYQDVVSSGNEIPFSGSPTALGGLIGTQHQRLTPLGSANGIEPSGTVSFRFPSGSGFLMDFSVRNEFTYVPATGDIVTAPVAYNTVREIEIVSQGNVIVFRTGKALLANFLTMKNSAFQKHSLYHAQMLQPDSEILSVVNVAQPKFVTYIAFDESFLTSPERYLLLNAINLELRITFEPIERSGLVGGNYSVSSTLFVDSYIPELSVYNQMVLKNWTDPFKHEFTNSFTEYGNILTDTTASMQIASSFLSSKSRFMLQRVASGVGFYGNPLYKIHTISMTLNGIPFFDRHPLSRVNAHGARMGNSQVALSPVGAAALGKSAIEYVDNMVVIDWSVLADIFVASGFANFQELRSTTMTFTFAALVGDLINYRLIAVHDNYNLVQYNPAAGGAGYLQISAVN